MKINAVTFDVGGTLIEPWPSVGHVYAEVAISHGVKDVTPELLNARFKAAWRARKAFNDTRAGWEELVDEAFAGLTTALPSGTFFPELYDRFARAEAWHVYPDVRPALDELARCGIKLGIISNWDERLRELLRNLRLDDCFDVIVISCEVGAAKPSPQIFQHAAKELGMDPGRILHVGDSLEMDVAGAEAAGMGSVQIARRPDVPVPPALGSLSELAPGIVGASAKND